MKESKLAESKERPAPAPTEISQLLGKIGAAARVLNGAAGEATRRIEAVEQSLLDAEPGIAVWSTTLLTEKASYQREDGSAPEPAQRHVTLGFARVKKDKWGICVREELKVKRGVVSEDLTLLRKADRNLRILAVPHLEQLVREVLAELEQQIGALDAARAAGNGETPAAPAEVPSSSPGASGTAS